MKLAPAKYIGSMADENGQVVELFNLTEDIAGHPKDSTVSRQTLEMQDFYVPTFHVNEKMLIKGHLFQVAALTKRGLELRRCPLEARV